MHTMEVGKHGVVVTTIERSSATRQGFHVLHAVLVLVMLGLGLDKFFHLAGSSTALLAPGLVAKVPLAPHLILMIAGGIDIALGALAGAMPRRGGYLLAIWLVIEGINLMFARQFLFAVIVLQACAAAIAVARIQTAYERTTDLD
jgi:hypothetical protein